MNPDNVDRLVAKRKGEEANLGSTEDAWIVLNIKEPNRCLASEDISQTLCQVSPNAIDGLKLGKINKEVSSINASEDAKKKRGNPKEMLQTENMELDKFCDQMIGLLRSIQENHNESFVKENHDQLTTMVNKEENSKSNFKISEYRKEANSISMTGSFINRQDNRKERNGREHMNIFLPVEGTNTPIAKHSTTKNLTRIIQPCSKN